MYFLLVLLALLIPFMFFIIHECTVSFGRLLGIAADSPVLFWIGLAVSVLALVYSVVMTFRKDGDNHDSDDY